MPESVSTHSYLSLQAKRRNPFAARREHPTLNPDCFGALRLAMTTLAVIASQACQSKTPPICYPILLRRVVPGNDGENPCLNPDKEKTDVEVSDLNLDSRIEVTD